MSNNTTKVNNPMKVITGKDTRWSYANVWEAKSINGGAPKFSVSLIIPKSDTVTVQKIKAAIEAAYHEGEAKLKGNGRSSRYRTQRRHCLIFWTASPSRLSLSSRTLCVTAIPNAPMIPPTQDVTS